MDCSGVNQGRRTRANYTRVILVPVMARPRKINPHGETRRVVTLVPENVAHRIEREARKRGVSVAQVIREKLEQVA